MYWAYNCSLCIEHIITQRKKIQREMKTFSTVFILNATHTVTSNVIFHILFNEIFDFANIICMKIMWSILDVMRMHNYKETYHCMSLFI